jgi:hypothetical protein
MTMVSKINRNFFSFKQNMNQIIILANKIISRVFVLSCKKKLNSID